MSDLEPPEIPMSIPGSLEPKQPEKKGFFSRLFSKKEETNAVDPNIPVVNSLNNDLISMPSLDDNSNTSAQTTFPELPPIDDSTMSQNINNENQISGIMVAGSKSKEKSKTKLKASKNTTISEVKSKHKSKTLAKSHVKSRHNMPIPKVDESNQFDWTRDVKDQEILIHDNNRFNEDVNNPDISSLDINSLMTQSESHVEKNSIKAKDTTRTSRHENVFPKLEPINFNLPKLDAISQSDISSDPVSDFSAKTNDQPFSSGIVDSEHAELFKKVSTNHGKLKKKLHKLVHSKNPKKDEVKKLLSEYDEHVEKHIENKELELHSKKKHLEKLEKHINSREEELKEAHENVQEAHEKVISREEEINNIIATSVDKELTRRLKEEKLKLKEELKNTTKLNSELKKKLKALEDEKLKNNKEYEKTLEIERKKLTDLQITYEKKLAQLSHEQSKINEEKKELELKRRETLELIKRGDAASKELTHLKQIKEYLDKNKSRVEKDVSQDKELKIALEKAEKSIAEERKNLDNLIFSKYIENKLKGIKPETLETNQDWRLGMNSHPLYAEIEKCKNLLKSNNLNDAKGLYNKIRLSYDTVNVNRKEKEALYVALRELYNEIQLKIVENQMRR